MMYLDNAATTKPSKKVIDAIMPYLTELWYNPSSLYQPSTIIKKKIEESRETIAKFINANNNEIYFTSGGSEGNSWALQGFTNECWIDGIQPIIITSNIEHKSILNYMKDSCADFYFAKSDNKGFINLDELESTLVNALKYQEHNCIEEYRLLVSIQFANNEIGTIQNIKMISDLVHKYGGIFHTDSVQAFGHIPIDVKELGIDMLTASGHKVNALKGSGFLYKKDGIKIAPLIYGTQENGMRGGTENVISIISLGEAIKHIDFKKIEEVINKRDYFINLLESKFGCKLNGCNEYRLPNNINVTFSQNITGESLLYTLDLNDIYIATGSACNSQSIEPSYVLKSIGLTDEEAMKTARFTLTNDITYEEIDKVIEEINKAIKLISLESDGDTIV